MSDMTAEQRLQMERSTGEAHTEFSVLLRDYQKRRAAALDAAWRAGRDAAAEVVGGEAERNQSLAITYCGEDPDNEYYEVVNAMNYALDTIRALQPSPSTHPQDTTP